MLSLLLSQGRRRIIYWKGEKQMNSLKGPLVYMVRFWAALVKGNVDYFFREKSILARTLGSRFQCTIYCITRAEWRWFQTNVWSWQHEWRLVLQASRESIAPSRMCCIHRMYDLRRPRIGAECKFFSKYACATGLCIFPLDVRMLRQKTNYIHSILE